MRSANLLALFTLLVFGFLSSNAQDPGTDPFQNLVDDGSVLGDTSNAGQANDGTNLNKRTFNKKLATLLLDELNNLEKKEKSFSEKNDSENNELAKGKTEKLYSNRGSVEESISNFIQENTTGGKGKAISLESFNNKEEQKLIGSKNNNNNNDDDENGDGEKKDSKNNMNQLFEKLLQELELEEKNDLQGNEMVEKKNSKDSGTRGTGGIKSNLNEKIYIPRNMEKDEKIYIPRNTEKEEKIYIPRNKEVENKNGDEENQSRDAVDPCGGEQPLVIQQTTGGVIKSPGYSSNLYSNNAKCSWKFIAPADKAVKLTFIEMSIEMSNNCTYDSVQVWDVVNRKGEQIAKACGTTPPAELLMSSEGILYVFFISDVAGNFGRFMFQFDYIDIEPPTPSNPDCGNPAVKPNALLKIVNGEVSRPHSWPWQVSIRLVLGTKQYHICGGSIISRNVIVTAAHCFFDKSKNAYNKYQIRVVAGDHDQTTQKDGPTQSPDIKDIIVHSDYNPRSASSAYDIAVILFNSPLTYNSNVSPICLPQDEVALKASCYATGWGDTRGTGVETLLNQVKLPIVSQSVCTQGNHYGSKVTPTMFCAGYEQGYKDACQGDSGGPFVCYNPANSKWYLHGITSWGAECAQPLKPGVYTRVTSYLDWIKTYSGVLP